MSRIHSTFPAQKPDVAAWPEGVIARHLTRAAEILRDPEATVDVVDRNGEAVATCRGCGWKNTNYSYYLNTTVAPAAARHAETCRALPGPEVS